MLSSVMKKLHGPVYARRIAVLVDLISPHLQEGDRILDVGCGNGMLGHRLMHDPSMGKRVEVEGVEAVVRSDTMIRVTQHTAGPMPWPDGQFDVVMLADVLHHEQDPHALLSECCRLARRYVIIKDHRIDAFFGGWRVSLLDWLANRPYDVPCLYRYNRLQDWRQWHRDHQLHVVQELDRLPLYGWPYRLIFTAPLQYFAVLQPSERAQGTSV